MAELLLKGWIEQGGRRFSEDEVLAVLTENPRNVSLFGGEFYLRYGEWQARDRFGIMPGPCPAGTVTCDGEVVGRVGPDYPAGDLEEAIVTAVGLRAVDGAAVALSGGVDSALVAALARLPAVVVGLEGSHDRRRALALAEILGIPCDAVAVTEREVEGALQEVVALLGDPNPVDASIATTEVFVARWAEERGIRRVLTGQGADELFGGYARYLETDDLAAALERDVADLPRQVARDGAVAAHYGTAFSPPYLDLRVVAAARAIPPGEKVRDGVRKAPLRKVAERHIPPEFARAEKKAMQYGSGIWKTIQRLACHNGYKKSVQGYLTDMGRDMHGF
ncbi:MAG: asparagine synthase C-terminal domain-containing protein [Methanofollis sp.]|uniref:asparagine synthase C-terminal domain-containing protein n=1 Tax=Methanofollis sp. TaxID=2052835 RepID=UPI002626FCC5|nr:asparagine synthase C-terminal domain-containing protein [Methanofollis sp.]MDD4254024.1 asparagine synthase C-terminal domain-containing protein [Methanofollis sp.]